MSTTGAGQPEVGIIGAGWAGLAAAVRLAEGGVRVTVFESARQPGGRARSIDLDGIEVDNGQHILLGAYRETLALIDTVNGHGTAQLLRRPLALAVQPGFSLRTPRLPAPWHLAAGLLTARGLGIGDRLRVVRFLGAIRRLDFCLPQDMALSELLARHCQSARLARFLWHPLCLAALNTPPHEASAQVFLNVLRDAFARARSDSDLLLPRVNLSTLFPEPAASYVSVRGGSVHLGSRVTAIASQPGGFALRVNGEVRCFSHVICAAPPRRSAELLASLPSLQPTADRLRTLAHQPIYSVYLRYPAGTRLPEPMLGLAEGPGQWVFDRGLLGGQNGLMAVVISAHGAHEGRDHAGLAQEIASQLHALLGLPAAPLWARVVAEKQATFACTPGLCRPPSRTPLPGLYLAGDYVAGDYPATIEGAVRSGVQCARHILEPQ